MNKKIFKLFANCVIVKGASLATICDLHRGKVYSIPLPFAQFLEETKNKDIYQALDKFSKEDSETILEYIAYLEQQELGFWTDEPERYPDLDLQWKSPEHISNAIIELDLLSNQEIKKITNALTDLYCKFVELRFYKTFNPDSLDFFAKNCSDSVIRSITVFLPYTSSINFQEIENISVKYPRIVLFVIHSAKEKYVSQNMNNPKIKFISRKIDSQNHCGIIDPKLFSIKIPVFTESFEHNSCLNKKMSIDIEGNIKNCPSMAQIFGNIKTDIIEDIISTTEFQKSWNIHKDLIDTCKDCEYRRICTDCRAYVENPEDDYSKPLKCGYDPYTNQWKEWSTNPLKREAIKFYSFQEFLKN